MIYCFIIFVSVNLKFAFENVTIDDSELETVIIFGGALTPVKVDNIVSVTVLEKRSISHDNLSLQGGKGRVYELIMQYQPPTNGGFDVFINVKKVTTTNTPDTVVHVPPNALNITKNFQASMSALPVFQKENGITYNLFFPEFGGTITTTALKIVSKRITHPGGNIVYPFVTDAATDTLHYSAAAKVSNAERNFTHDVFAAYEET